MDIKAVGKELDLLKKELGVDPIDISLVTSSADRLLTLAQADKGYVARKVIGIGFECRHLEKGSQDFESRVLTIRGEVELLKQSLKRMN